MMKRMILVAWACGTLAGVAADLSRVVDPMISITPVTRSFLKEGGTGGITTGGSGTWHASSSDKWISVKTPSGTPPAAVAYTVEANDDVETRVGTVWVSGYRHTVTQSGTGAALGEYSADFESAGGQGAISVLAADGNAWTAHANVDWLVPAAANGSGSGSLAYTVRPYDEVSTRSGTITVAGNTFTVNQTGARMKLTASGATTDYFADTIKIRINALASTEWSVSVNPEASDWVTITDAGSGRGGDTVTLALAENPNASERTAVVTIGTETFNIRQLKRTNLVFKIGSTELAVGSDGVTGERIAVTATPALTWTAAASADWIELYADYMAGSGNGSIAYKVKPNPTLYARSGTIAVTAGQDGVAPKKFEVTQAAAVSELSISSYVFEATGEAVDVGVNVPDIVGWNIRNIPAWLTVAGAAVTGPATLTLTAAANPSVKPRTATLSIADHDFTVTQKGRGVTVDYTAKVFDTDGKTTGANSENIITVTADSDVSWTAEASDATWIVIYEGQSGRGNGTVKYIVAPYVGAGEMRTGTIAIGDQIVTITQRPYEVMIDPVGTNVVGNAGAGEIQVALDIGGVLQAFCNDEWIKITVDYNEQAGRGKVLYTYLDNNTGKTRVGKINISGTEYTLEQLARQNVALTTEVDGHGGTVSGGGTYNIGSTAKLIAEADPGYAFVAWILPGGTRSVASELTIAVTSAQTYTAVFEPLKPTLAVASASLAGVRLAWTNVPWAATYRIYRHSQFNRSQATAIATLENDATCAYLDATGTENQAYWYWVEAIGAEDDVWSESVTATRSRQSFSITYTNLRGTTHDNPSSYVEGTERTFNAPSGRRGYTFVGWSPSQITTDMTGDVAVRAIWLQNTYSVAYDPNGGASEMAEQNFTYGLYQYLAQTNLTRSGYTFAGWSTTKNGTAEYLDQQSLKNLSESLNGVVTLYAVWNALLGIEGDTGAVITGNETDGYIIKPSEGKTEEVAVIVPAGFDPTKITVEVSPEVKSVLANGATLKIVKGAHDITAYLNIPAADGTGHINLALAEVKEEVVKDILDTTRKENPAELTLDASNPSIKTAPTKPGLTYEFYEGATLEAVGADHRAARPASTKLGDGSVWTPTITVKGGASGFYSIDVKK